MNNIDTLCFSAGGTNSFCFFGALNYIINNNIIDINKINTFAGTSVGAMVAYLLSLKYNINELILFITNYDINFIKNINIYNLFFNYGIDDGKKIYKFLQFFLIKKFNKNDITFIELYNLTHNILIINGTKINNNITEEIIFSKDTNPHMSVLLALRITISIPIIYTPVYYNNNYYIDGAVTNFFPYNHCNYETTLGLCINNINIRNPFHFMTYNLTQSKKKYNFITIYDFNISSSYIKYLINYGENICKNKLKNNFNNNLSYDYTYYNHIYYILIYILILIIIYKYLLEK